MDVERWSLVSLCSFSSRVLVFLTRQANKRITRDIALALFWQRQPPSPRETFVTRGSSQRRNEGEGRIIVKSFFVCFVFQSWNQAIKTVCVHVDTQLSFAGQKCSRVPLGGLALSGRLSLTKQQTLGTALHRVLKSKWEKN